MRHHTVPLLDTTSTFVLTSHAPLWIHPQCPWARSADQAILHVCERYPVESATLWPSRLQTHSLDIGVETQTAPVCILGGRAAIRLG